MAGSVQQEASSVFLPEIIASLVQGGVRDLVENRRPVFDVCCHLDGRIC